MGAAQSNAPNGTQCFCIPPVLNTGKRDAIGSPLPDTPIFERKRQKEVHDAIMKESTPFAKKYGLEKESSSLGLFIPPRRSTGPSRDMQVYEGADCEQKMQEKYDLREVLGVGSSSTVHRCVSRSSGESFACKVIDCQHMDEKFRGMMSQFQTEIEVLRELRHPGIIRLYDVYIKTDKKIFIITELMEGGELFDYVVQKGTLTEDEASGIVRKVTSALVFMHSKHIVHRDLKPENLLLTKPARGSEPIEVKIIDFGLSKAMEEVSMASTFLGTRGFLAPELVQRQEYTKAVDSWALGVIVFVLLCGCLPFDDDSSSAPSEELLRKRFQLRFPRWARNLSASAKDLLSHLLDVNPVTRYTTEQAMDHPWVRGKTAPKGNLLASPGRIRTPNSSRGGQVASRGVRKHALAPDISTPPPPNSMRKTGSL